MRLRNAPTNSATKASYASPFGADAVADGSLEVREKPGDEFVHPAVPAGEQWYSPESVVDQGGAIHIGAGGGYANRDPFIEAYLLATDSWYLLRGRPDDFAMLDYCAFVIDDKAYVFGGSEDTDRNVEHPHVGWAYDPASDSWTVKTPVPGIPGLSGKDRDRLGGEAATRYGDNPGRFGFAFGGSVDIEDTWESTRQTERYDRHADAWSVAGPGMLGPARDNMATTAIENNIYAMGGGIDQNDEFGNQIPIVNNDVLDTETETWSARQILPELPLAKGARRHGAASSLYGNVHLLGGWAPWPEGPQKRHDRYRPALDVWDVIPPSHIFPDAPLDPDAPDFDYDEDWKQWFPYAPFHAAAAFTLRGGVHLTGGIWERIAHYEGEEPELTARDQAIHARWTYGSWSWTVRQPSLETRTLHMRMGAGWRDVGGDGTGLLKYHTFGPPFDKVFRDAGHKVLTL